MPPKLILASASPYRLAQLNHLGLITECVPPAVDEDALKRIGGPPRQLAVELALAKANAVAERRPDAVVIGGDQIASVDGRLFDKPGGIDAAKRQLREFSGRTLELATAVAIVHSEATQTHVEPVQLDVRLLTDDEIVRYLEADEPFDCAGCFRWEGRGPSLFTAVRTNDPTAIIGLPLLWLANALRKLGYAIP